MNREQGYPCVIQSEVALVVPEMNIRIMYYICYLCTYVSPPNNTLKDVPGIFVNV